MKHSWQETDSLAISRCSECGARVRGPVELLRIGDDLVERLEARRSFSTEHLEGGITHEADDWSIKSWRVYVPACDGRLAPKRT